MTIEYILLLTCFGLLIMSTLLYGPRDTFRESGPKLAARIEKHLNTGTGFNLRDGKTLEWVKPE